MDRGRRQRGNNTPRGQRGYWRGQMGQPPSAGGSYQRGGFYDYGYDGSSAGGPRPSYNRQPHQENNGWPGTGRGAGRGRGAHSVAPDRRSNQPNWYPPATAGYGYIPMFVPPRQYYVNNFAPPPQPPLSFGPRNYFVDGGYGHFSQPQQSQQQQQPQRGRSNWEAKRTPTGSNNRPTSDGADQHRSSAPKSEKRAQPPSNKSTNPGTEDDGTQRDRLTEDLSSGDYECMVCCERVRQTQQIWNCRNCYNIFHLVCVRKWARASTEEVGWRCPGCQFVTENVPYDYLCFCGKRRDPEWNRYDTPHSCGEECARKRRSGQLAQVVAHQDECLHPCNLLCHPGPCPPCGTYVARGCKCGKLTQQVRCGQSTALSCDNVCDKLLTCGRHVCEMVCHAGQCEPCGHKIDQGCYCGKETRQIPCGAEEDSEGYICQGVCGGKLDCGHHQCESACHPNTCEPCRLSPNAVTHCPCGLSPLSELLGKGKERTECTDPIPTCDKLCNKELECGPKDGHHKCTSKCHVGTCPPCALKSSAPCRCGHVVRQVECHKIFGENKMAVTCERRCKERKSCGRHKCQNRCCADREGEGDHKCSLICGRRLKCGLHSCPEPCHPSNCQPCWNASFEELACHCGATITYPPVPCGTKPPECHRPCSRRHQCEHPIMHNCHSDAQCPPCTYLTEKWCYGRHEKRTCIPCHQTAVCCGLSCAKPLPCGRHKCTKVCHLGPCVKPDAAGVACTQPCPETRPACGHPCGAPCHSGDCPAKGSCKTQVSVKCNCGQRKVTMTCAERAQAHRRLVAAAVASKLRTDNETVNLTEASQLINIDTVLDCNEACAATERNRRVALALQIRNPDLSDKLSAPAYSDFLKDQSKLNPPFVTSVYEKLTELVLSAKKSKQKSRSHAFAPMRNEMRRVIHELAELFGCESQSYDEEPKKNVVVTAYRDKSWLPSVSLLNVVQKETGASRPAGKAPPPVPHYHVLRGATQQPEGHSAATPNTSLTSALDKLTLPKEAGTERTGKIATTTTPDEPVIDYFDYTG